MIFFNGNHKSLSSFVKLTHRGSDLTLVQINSAYKTFNSYVMETAGVAQLSPASPTTFFSPVTSNFLLLQGGTLAFFLLTDLFCLSPIVVFKSHYNNDNQQLQK